MMFAKRVLVVGISILMSLPGTDLAAGAGQTQPVASQHAYYFGQADFPAGTNPSALVSADFNEDGIADFVVTRPVDNVVGLLTGRPDATFALPADFPTGATPVALATGDFNRDGHIDLAVVDQGSNSISILLGHGDGTFSVHVDYAVGSAPDGIAVADFDGNGIPDIAVANRDSNSVSILLGTGDGTFAPAATAPAGASPVQVMAADFNRDGTPDLVVNDEDFNGGIILLRGNGNGTFQAPVTVFQGLEPPFFGSHFTIADLNGDHFPDLAVTSLFPDLTLTVLLGNGDGTFRSAISSELGGQDSSEIVAGELHAAGIQDLILLGSAGTLSVMKGNGDGTFSAPVVFGAGPGGASPVVGDFTRDGASDVAFALRGANAVGVLVGNGDGTFSTRRDYSAGRDAASVVAADFNRDGFPDLAVINALDATVSILLNNGKGAFGSPVAVPVGSNPTSLVAGDYNNDGNLDLAVGSAGNSISISLGSGDGTFQSIVDYPAGPNCQQVIASDFNGDGNLDLAAVNSGTLYQGNTVSVLLGNGDGTFQAQKILSTATGPASLAAGDFNHDGKLDLAVGFNTGGIAIFLGLGDGSFAVGASYNTPKSVRSIASGDLNGDGVPDLVVPGAVFTANGDGTFQSKTDDLIGSVVYLADLNLDGKLDLLTVDPDSGSSVLAVRFGAGDGTLAPPRYFEVGVEAFSIGAADFNADGAVDFVASNLGPNDVSTLSVYLESPVVALGRNPVHFNTEKVGTTTKPRSLPLYNPGAAPLQDLSLATTGDFKATSDCGNTVAAGSGCRVSLTFAPTSSGKQEGMLVLSDNAPSSPQKVVLLGKGK